MRRGSLAESLARPAGVNKLEQGASLSNAMKSEGFIPRSRLEALTDGVFAFAMTLLVVNIELPVDFHPKTNQEFLDRLFSLSDTFTAYLITFFVLVSFWFGRAQENRGTRKGQRGLRVGDAPASPVGHLHAVLDAGGQPIRRCRGGLDLRRQHDHAGGHRACHLAHRSA